MSYYQRDKVTDVIAVLKTIRGEFEASRNYRNTTELRKDAVKIVAESELRGGRYKNTDSAQKTIHDACARRLRPQVGNIIDFDNLIDQWLRQHSTRLGDILLSHSPNRLRRTEVNQWFKEGEKQKAV